MNGWMKGLAVALVLAVMAGCALPPSTPQAAQPREGAQPTVSEQSPAVLTPAQETEMRVKPKTLRQGDQWPVRGGQRFLLITGPEAWATFLRQQRSQPDSWPKVDWEREVVLVALMGGKRTGGYRITVEEVRVGDGAVVVRVQEVSPRPDEMVIQVLTSPFHVVTVPRDVFPPPPFTLRFVSPSGVWEVDVPSIEEDGLYEATLQSASPFSRPTGEAEK